MESSSDDSAGDDVDALLSGEKKVNLKPRLFYAMDEVWTADTDEADLCSCKLHRFQYCYVAIIFILNQICGKNAKNRKWSWLGPRRT